MTSSPILMYARRVGGGILLFFREMQTWPVKCVPFLEGFSGNSIPHFAHPLPAEQRLRGQSGDAGFEIGFLHGGGTSCWLISMPGDTHVGVSSSRNLAATRNRSRCPKFLFAIGASDTRLFLFRTGAGHREAN
jgi:hypothetical protein